MTRIASPLVWMHMTSPRHVIAVWLLVAAGGCGENAVQPTAAPMVRQSRPMVPPAATAEPLPSPAPPITAEAMVSSPQCLGFSPTGNAAYVLVTHYDPGVPEWWIRVQAAGSSGDELTLVAETPDKRKAQATFSTQVDRVNALIREGKLVACTAVVAGSNQSVETTVRGTRVRISYADGNLVVAPEGQPPIVRPQTEIVDLSLVAVYTAPRLPGLAVVLRDHISDVVIAERSEWFVLEGPALDIASD